MQTAVAIVFAGLLVAGAILWIGRYEPFPTTGYGTVILDRLRGELRLCKFESDKWIMGKLVVKCYSLGPVASPPN